MQAMASARIERDSASVPLVQSSSQPVIILGKEMKPAFNYIPLLCILLLVATLWISSKEHRNRALFFWFDAILFGIAGIAGFIIFYLTSFSVHPLVSFNWNVVWLNPLLLVFALTVLFRKTRRFAFYLQRLFLVCDLFMLIGLFILPQSFVISEILLIIVLALRSIMTVEVVNRDTTHTYALKPPTTLLLTQHFDPNNNSVLLNYLSKYNYATDTIITATYNYITHSYTFDLASYLTNKLHKSYSNRPISDSDIERMVLVPIEYTMTSSNTVTAIRQQSTLSAVQIRNKKKHNQPYDSPLRINIFYNGF